MGFHSRSIKGIYTRLIVRKGTMKGNAKNKMSVPGTLRHPADVCSYNNGSVVVNKINVEISVFFL